MTTSANINLYGTEITLTHDGMPWNILRVLADYLSVGGGDWMAFKAAYVRDYCASTAGHVHCETGITPDICYSYNVGADKVIAIEGFIGGGMWGQVTDETVLSQVADYAVDHVSKQLSDTTRRLAQLGYSVNGFSPVNGVLQRALDGEVVNHTVFGRTIYQHKGDYVRLLWDHGLEFGPLDGGCHPFALGMQLYLKDNGIECTLTSVGSKPADHIVVAVETGIGGVYIDGDGVATADDLLAKMRVCEMIGEPKIYPFTTDQAVQTGALTYDEIGMAKYFRALFHAQLGSITPKDIVAIGGCVRSNLKVATG